MAYCVLQRKEKLSMKYYWKLTTFNHTNSISTSMGDVAHFMSPLMCKTFPYCSLYCYISSESHDSLLYSCHDVLIMELKRILFFGMGLEILANYDMIKKMPWHSIVKEVYRHILTIADFCAISSWYACPGLSHFGMFDKRSMLRVIRDATRRTMSPRSFMRSSGPGRNETGAKLAAGVGTP